MVISSVINNFFRISGLVCNEGGSFKKFLYSLIMFPCCFSDWINSSDDNENIGSYDWDHKLRSYRPGSLVARLFYQRNVVRGSAMKEWSGTLMTRVATVSTLHDITDSATSPQCLKSSFFSGHIFDKYYLLTFFFAPKKDPNRRFYSFF